MEYIIDSIASYFDSPGSIAPYSNSFTDHRKSFKVAFIGIMDSYWGRNLVSTIGREGMVVGVNKRDIICCNFKIAPITSQIRLSKGVFRY